MIFSKDSTMKRKKKIRYKKSNEIRLYIRHEKFYFVSCITKLLMKNYLKIVDNNKNA